MCVALAIPRRPVAGRLGHQRDIEWASKVRHPAPHVHYRSSPKTLMAQGHFCPAQEIVT